MNSALGGWQEWHAQQQSQSLQKLLRIRATVLRDRSAVEVDAEELVRGDIVAIESGQRIPADLRLLDDHGLEAEEAAVDSSGSAETSLAPKTVADLNISGASEVTLLTKPIQLATDISGDLHDERGILDLVDRLHPTPAVGGWPRAAALELLEEQEGVKHLL